MITENNVFATTASFEVFLKPTTVTLPLPTNDVRIQTVPGSWFNAATNEYIRGINVTQRTKTLVVRLAPTQKDVARGYGILHDNLSDELIGKLAATTPQLTQTLFTSPLCFLLPVYYNQHYTTAPKRWIYAFKEQFKELIRVLNPELVITCGSLVTTTFLSYFKISKVTYDSIKYTTFKLPDDNISIYPIQDPVEAATTLARELVYVGNMETTQSNKKQYIEVSSDAQLTKVIDNLIQRQCYDFAIDTEWGSLGNKCKYPYYTIRTVQISPQPHEAYCIVLRREKLVYDPKTCCSETHVRSELLRLLDRQNVRTFGHNLRGDMESLSLLGVPITLTCYSNGADTMLMFSLTNKYKDNAGLEHLTKIYTDLTPYHLEVEAHAKGFSDTNGYAFIPDDILIPYACADVDAVSQIWPKLIKELQDTPLTHPYVWRDQPINTMYDYYKKLMQPVTLALIEVESVGLPLDTERVKSLIEVLHFVRKQKLEKLQELLNWPDFNVNSVYHLQELCYGAPWKKAPQRPANAIVFNFKPIKSTKTSLESEKPWDEIDPDLIRKKLVSPAVDMSSIKLFIRQATTQLEKDVLTLLYELQATSQIAKNNLHEPEYDETTKKMIWTSGLMYEVDPDGYVRSNIAQLTDTGRYNSSRPNLQNFPKKQEDNMLHVFATQKLTEEQLKLSIDELKAQGLLHKGYYPLRSCIKAPDGFKLVEADYSQAELMVLAHLSKDPLLLEILTNPSRDLHSETAHRLFKLDCPVSDVKKLYPSKRIITKTIIFGLIYGRGAKAIASELNVAGMQVTEEETKKYIQDFFITYPKVQEYIKKQHELVTQCGYVETAYGRRRYFQLTGIDSQELSGILRQAQNTPIQGTVAGVIDIALANLQQERDKRQLKLRILLPIHDAILMLVPDNEVEVITKEVLPKAMIEDVVVPHTALKFRIDISVCTRWGEDE